MKLLIIIKENDYVRLFSSWSWPLLNIPQWRTGGSKSPRIIMQRSGLPPKLPSKIPPKLPSKMVFRTVRRGRLAGGIGGLLLGTEK